MKKLTFIIVAIVMTAFKAGPTKDIVEENSIKVRTISFEAIHNLNVPMVYADGRIGLPIQTNNHLIDVLKSIVSGNSKAPYLNEIQNN